ncbi:MAG: glycoside hydrolase family 38 C-terminal domain-containing protein [Eubacteriales bacterium]|nr:glycoside hydrolase family 38 C-terminal domain-containing protein [Eubacteriales bacterium]
MQFLRERIGEILRQLQDLCYPYEEEITDWKGQQGHFPLTDHVSADIREWKEAVPYKLGNKEEAWFALGAEIRIPEEMAGMPAELYVSTGREGEWDATNPQIAAYVRGGLSQGLDVNHRSLYLTECAEAGEVFPVFLSVYTGERGSVLQWGSRLRAVDTAVKEFYYDLLVPWQCLELMEKGSCEYEQLLAILNSTVNLLDLRKKGSLEFRESLERAKAFLHSQAEQLPESSSMVTCVGHTHIDVAWLWTLRVTREKTARSFATVLKLMERYPEYLFMSSQPQLYQYVKKNQPELYEKIKKRVKEGRWEPEGAMFLEADCNLTSGESLVRQCLYGKKFFMREFGSESRILWLPDVFGYSAALPQIMEKCGIHSFMTTKISWNETNKIPFDTFWWEGIDGTKILTHFITTRDYDIDGKRIATNNEFTTDFSTNYNGYIHPSQIKGAWQRYQQKGLNQNVLISFGYGDGGGGPTEEMLETARRLKDGHFGCPKVQLEPAGDFFRRLHETSGKVKFPVWSGELYLEYHRGTYTSRAENKRANRKGEFALLNAEVWSVLARQYGSLPYPIQKLSQGWEILMRNQFHDILPGSAIAEVYEDCEKEYGELNTITGQIQEDALSCLTEKIEADKDEIIVFNPNGTAVSEIVEISGADIPARWISKIKHLEKAADNDDRGSVWNREMVSCDGRIFPVQCTKEGNFIFRAENVPAKGWKVYTPLEGDRAGNEFYCTETETVTPFCRLRWNESGQITSFYDKLAERELLQKGKNANVLMTYEDKPHKFDNWNIFEYYEEKQWPVDCLVSRRVTEQGPVRMALELIWVYLDSRITETFYFYPDSPRIDIKASIDWQEEQILLKALFPLDLNAREACYEIQYGNVKRSTVKNTSWEQARFEVCFQKWLDIGEYDYGVSFMSDSKYGVSINENEVGLTLLKSGVYPAPEADKGNHSFIYSVFPHLGSWQEAGTVREAYGLNNPLQARRKKTGTEGVSRNFCPIFIPQNNIIAEVLKGAEEGNALIVRLYECWNRRTIAQLSFAEVFAKVYTCDMLEKEEVLVAEQADQCIIEFRPFEIVTLKVIYKM